MSLKRRIDAAEKRIAPPPTGRPPERPPFTPGEERTITRLVTDCLVETVGRDGAARMIEAYLARTLT